MGIAGQSVFGGSKRQFGRARLAGVLTQLRAIGVFTR
jgi:hypothetical protein